MDIKMLETRRGSEDGFNSLHFSKGVVYYGVAHTLACEFINNKWAREATQEDCNKQIEDAQNEYTVNTGMSCQKIGG